MNDFKPRVLLVEDNPADANLVEEAFAEAHFDCELSIVRNGADAIEFIETLDSNPARCRLDLVLLDLNLPKVGGETVLKRLRSSTTCKTAKVIVISSSDAASDRERVKTLGANDYFHKPSNLEQFMQLGPRVQAMLES